MRPRSWHAANELGSLWARLTIDTVAGRACPQHLAERALATSRDGPPRNRDCASPRPEARERVKAVQLSPRGLPHHHTPSPWGRKGQCCTLLWTLLMKKNQMWREEVFKPSACNVREYLMSAVQGSFLDWCWVHISIAMPILIDSALGTIPRQRHSWRACRNWHGRIHTVLL